MATTRTYSRSFSGGEISPEMFGRIDDVKFQTGAAAMRNFIALPQGPAQNRAGLAYVNEVKDSTKRTRLIPFTFSTTQTMVIEVGAGYFRFHTQGATLGPGTPAAYNGATSYAVGDLVASGGVNYYCIAATTGNAPPNATYWYAMPAGIYEIPNPYAEGDLFDIHYVQSADVLTLVHPGHAPRELRRLGATTWTFTTITFGSTLAAPGSVTATATRGQGYSVTGAVIASDHLTLQTDPSIYLAKGDSVYVSGIVGNATLENLLNDKFFIVENLHAGNNISLLDYQTAAKIDFAGGTYTSGGLVQAMLQTSELTNEYVVTTVAAIDGTESAASSSATATNNLAVAGSYNTITWAAVSGAQRYNVYKKQNGLFGYVGQTNGTSFVDNNIAPDMGLTPPIYDTIFASGGNYPGAVSYFEQRRVFAGTNNEPQNVWMTASATESNMSYSIPVQDDDRIAFRIAAREANTIRHVVPLTQLLLLTSGGEWRVSPVNSDVLTPTTVAARPQSYIGSNNVQPQVVNNAVVYCAARGGHVRELGYSWQASGFVTGDLSLRAAHLFDELLLTDMCYSKSPNPLLWFVSSNGNLLGLTYIPEQQVASWHRHDTDGTFESCCAVAEGDEDRLYVVVKRTIGGTTKRYVERMASRLFGDLKNAFFVDSGLTYDGTNTGATTMTVTGGTNWSPAEILTLTASAGTFNPPDVGDVIVLTDVDGTQFRLTITAFTSGVSVSVRPDKVIAPLLRGTATTNWSFARDVVSGLSHIEGKVVSILADGAVMPQATVTGGAVTLQRPATVVHVGLPYESDLQTLPLALQMEGFGQGRVKNINEAWLRVVSSSGIFVGPTANKLVEAKQRTTEPYGSPPSLKTDEIGIKLTPSWQANGQIYVRQSDPLPLTIVGLTLEIAIGG